jgi:hypothetical protein
VRHAVTPGDIRQVLAGIAASSWVRIPSSSTITAKNIAAS